MSRYEPERRRPTPIGALAWVAGIALLAAVVLFVGKQLVLWSNAAPPTATPAADATDAPSLTDGQQPTDTPTPGDTLPPTATPTVEISPIPPEGLTCTVQENDSIWVLCTRFYGEYSEALGQRIIDANVAKHPAISPDGTLYVGWVILIPPGDPDVTFVPQPTSTPAPTVAVSPIPTEGASCKIVSGNTLSGICIRFYGTSSDALVQKVVDANKTKYPTISANHLQSGWVLVIPYAP